MLPPFIIEQIRKREDRSTREAEQPRLELPLGYAPLPRGPVVEEDDPNRGVITIDLT
jgi:hypothetical protein